MRHQVHDRFLAGFALGSRVLEIGCGVGHDTVFLAGRGVDVVACDPAPGMIRETTRRLDAAGLGHRVTVAPVGVEAMDAWLRQHPTVSGSFDGLVSNFGPLNCVDDLRGLERLVATRVTPGGRLVICLMAVCAGSLVSLRHAPSDDRDAPMGARR